jgi:hypothetical protein
MLLSLLMACGTMSGARPLDPGQHAVGATLGGAIIDVGPATIPLPNVVVEGRSGLQPVLGRPFDVNYGVNATGLAFGIVQVHGGVSWLVLDQNGWVPAVSASNRLYVFSNHVDRRKDTHAWWFVDQLEVLASWDTRPALIYGGVAEYLDFRQPSLLLTPVLGAQFHLGERWGIQLEGRHYAINRNKEPLNTMPWITWGPGSLGVTLGVSRTIGGTP